MNGIEDGDMDEEGNVPVFGSVRSELANLADPGSNHGRIDPTDAAGRKVRAVGEGNVRFGGLDLGLDVGGAHGECE